MLWKLTCYFLLFELIAAQLAFTMDAAFFEKTYVAGVNAMNLTWSGADGPVTVKLLDNRATLQLCKSLLVTDLPLSNHSYPYYPSVAIADGNYTFGIFDTTGQKNYDKWFTLTGGAAPTTSSSPSQPTSILPAQTPSISPPSPSASSASNTSQSHSGLSTGDKAAIGVGAALGAVLIAVLVWFAWWHGRRSAKRSEKLLSEQGPNSPSQGVPVSPYPPSYTPDTARAMSPELRVGEPRRDGDLATIASTVEAAGPLSEDEKKELQRRRRAAELEGSVHTVVPGVVSERAELESRRKGASWETSVLSL
ncbi:hypothetical protein N431DRAFT_404488 [Stipitochalara longipes BDJ]|nr:hypothetical protein N431DRAFT_404488 [Stipitochalara longipes BDJ]